VRDFRDGEKKFWSAGHLMKGGERTALKVSDFLTQTQFRNSEIYGTYREWGFKYNMGVVINASFGKAACVGLYDSKRDFTEHDRLTPQLVPPPLQSSPPQSQAGDFPLCSQTAGGLRPHPA
jgi:hypothetical protein